MLRVSLKTGQFTASPKNPLLLVSENDCDASRVARSLVFLDYPSCFHRSQCTVLSTATSNAGPQLPTPYDVTMWRASVSFISLQWSGPPRESAPEATVLDTFQDARRYAAQRGKPCPACDVLPGCLSSLALHPSTQYAPWQELTRNESSLALIAIALALSPCVIVLDGKAKDQAVSKAIVDAACSRGVSLVWANSGAESQKWMTEYRGASVERVCSSMGGGSRSGEKCLAEGIRKWSPSRVPSQQYSGLTWGLGLVALVGPVLAEPGVAVRIEKAIDEGGKALNHAAGDVQLWQLVLCFLLLFAVMGVLRYLEVGLEGAFFMAGLRCVVQLSILGYVLVPVFRIDEWWLVLGCLCFMVVFAAREAAARPAYTYPGMWRHVLYVLSGVFTLTLAFGVVVLQSGISALVIIPIGGMVLQACLSSTALALTNGLAYLAENKGNVEVLLCLGATRLEATRDCTKRSVTLGVTPYRLLMLTSGVVTISGMMAGQLLAGAEPINAARYQIVILFLNMASTTFACTLATVTCILAIVDDCHRIRSERLSRRGTGEPSVFSQLGSAVVEGLAAVRRSMVANTGDQTPLLSS